VFNSPFFTYLWRFAGAFSVRSKIMGIVVALALLLGVGVAVQVRTVFLHALEERLQEQSISVARDVAARATDMILVNDLFALYQLLEETRSNNPDLRYAFVVGQDGTVLAHTFGVGFPTELIEQNVPRGDDHHQTVLLETDEGPVWDTAVPIFDGRAGYARIGFSENSIQNSIALLTSQMVLTTVLVSAIGIVAAAGLTWIVTRPILQLKEAATAVGHGDFSQRLNPWANDEIGQLTAAFNGMTAELAQAEQERAEREQLRSQLLEKVIAAQEDERRRIARELHDETGQALTSLMVRLQMMTYLCANPELKIQVEELRQLTVQTLDGVHNLSVELRPSALDDLGLTAALERYIQEYQRHTAVEVDFVVMGLEERLPPPVETALYRMVQESLTNIARHAQAETASVLLERRPDRVRAIIEDDGVGFNPAVAKNGERLGLYGMRERAELLNGQLTIESTLGQGATIYIEVPL
jgi:signal transduction histidine kinase